MENPAPLLHPKHAPRTSEPSEIRVWEALRDGGLPQGWTAWQSVRIGQLSEVPHELDFVVAAPEYSVVLVIEIKGGTLSVRDGRWFQYERPMPKPPLDQAKAGVAALAARLRDICPQGAPWVEPIVLFPDTPFERGPAQDDLRGRVLGAQDLPYLAERLREIAERVKRGSAQGWVPRLHELWGETWVPRLGLAAATAADDEARVRLTEEQAWVLDALDENPRVVVRGGAGTGKSILAMAAARREAAAGRRVRVVTFTRAPARALARQLGSAAVVSTIDEWCAGLIDLPTSQLGLQHGPEWWEDLRLKAASAIADGLDCETLIVDEAQDLTPVHTLLIDEAAARGARLRIFGDDGAQRFWTDRADLSHWPDGAARLRLRRALRCAPAIQHLADVWAGQATLDRDIALSGVADGSVAVIEVNEDRRLAKIRGAVEKLRGESFVAAEIALLSLVGADRAEGLVRQHPDGLDAVAADHDEAGDRTILDTFLRFKGLERRAVVLGDIQAAQARADYATRMHIAASRATSVLRIVAVRAAIDADPVLAALAGRTE
jgi:hypothetical protein